MKLLLELHRIASDLTYLTNGTSTDESQLHVYEEILKKWFNNYNDFWNLESFLYLKDTVSRFSTHLELKTGTSMVRIWNNYKGCYPVSSEGWELYEKILKLSERFDHCSSKLFYDSVDHIKGLRGSIIETLSLTYSNEIGMLENVIEVRK